MPIDENCPDVNTVLQKIAVLEKQQELLHKQNRADIHRHANELESMNNQLAETRNMISRNQNEVSSRMGALEYAGTEYRQTLRTISDTVIDIQSYQQRDQGAKEQVAKDGADKTIRTNNRSLWVNIFLAAIAFFSLIAAIGAIIITVIIYQHPKSSFFSVAEPTEKVAHLTAGVSP